MGLLDRLAGRDVRPHEAEPEKAPEPTTSSVNAEELLRDSSAALGSLQPPGRLYDPYEGISAAIGGKKAMFQLPEGPEFVFQEEAAVRRRSWSENLSFYTGLGYLAGGHTTCTQLTYHAHHLCLLV